MHFRGGPALVREVPCGFQGELGDLQAQLAGKHDCEHIVLEAEALEGLLCFRSTR